MLSATVHRRIAPITLSIFGIVLATTLEGAARAQDEDEAWVVSVPSAAPASPTPSTKAATAPTALVVTGAPMTVYPPSTLPEKRSPGMIAAGGALLGIGLANAVVGLGVYVAGATETRAHELSPNGSVRFDGGKTDQTVGSAMMLAGGALVAVGIPLLVIGLRKHSVEPDRPAREARVVPTPTGLAMRF
jgi:hypothetical protein